MIFQMKRSMKRSETKSDKLNNREWMKLNKFRESINCIVSINKAKKDVKWCKEETKEKHMLMNIKRAICNQKVSNNLDK